MIVHVGVDKEFSPQGKAHPAFIVPDLLELENGLRDQGFEVTWDDALADRTRFYSTDPFGNQMEFLQEGDGFSQR